MAKSVSEFTYPLPVADREEQLFNNEYLSDITFSVGDSGERFYGHKLILTLASEVFYVQFNGQFEEAKQSDQPIVVTDIEPPIFRDVLRYMYCHKIDLTKENAIEVYYASQKYLLKDLNEKCEHFFASKIGVENVLEVFNENRKHEFAFVNESCLAVICDNPLACFQQEVFLTIERKSLEMIAGSVRINCAPEQLCEAIKNWAKDDELRSEHACQLTQIVLDVQHRAHDCSKFHNFYQWIFVTSIDSELQVSNPYYNPGFGIYGLGIFIKSQSPPIADAKLSLKLRIEYHNSSCLIKQQSVVKVVPFTMELRTEEVFFEKFIIDAVHYCKIRVTIVKLSDLPYMFSFSSFAPIDSILTVSASNYSNSKGNCVAYILYKNVK